MGRLTARTKNEVIRRLLRATMSVGQEINSIFKWTAVLLTLNGGLTLITLSAMARENGCTQHMQKTLLYPGVLLALAGAIGLFFAIVSALATWLITAQRARKP